jgi:signal transduction histidine kinase
LKLAGGFARLPIRHKLLALALLPLLGVLPLLGAGLAWWGNEALDGLLRTKVRADLAVAHGYFERVLSEVGASTAGIAESQALVVALTTQGGDVAGLLQDRARREKLDFIRLLPTAVPMSAGTHVELLTPEQQALLPPTLRDRVAVPLLDTRNAAPSERRVEERAMVLLSTQAVRDARGNTIGHLQAGVLLNRNLPFIDHINQIVYPEGSLPFASWGSRGTATLFLDDVRISTNVRLFGGAGEERAIGTRVSRSVRDAVLGQGATWLDRAFVVDDWYVSGYLPLADGSGRRVGMLYVGVLERPFTLLKWGALASIGLLFFAVMAIAAVVSLRWARAIFGPLEQMEATMQRVEGGTLDARVGPVIAQDEIGRLAGHLDRLLHAIEGHTRELDAKVAERTAALQTAQQQLVRSEKLATVGQLTASIAHEVNNPIAVIQGNLDLLRELLGPEATARVAPELRLVDEQIQRMRLIVTQLLQFARPTEFAGYVETLHPALVLEDCLVLVGHLLARTRIELRRDLQATRAVAINRQELQQVLVNLLVNAIHAMEGHQQGTGGTLQLATRDAGPDGVEISVADSGPGLPPDLLAQLFQPFVTRKREGTGLGLWISRGIVERYGGDITAANRPEGGALFTVRLKTEG